MVRGALLCIALVAVASPAMASEDGIRDLLYSIFNLLLLIAVLVYFARKPILEFFNSRRGKIQDDLHAAAELRHEAEQRFAKWQRKLVDLEEELEGIRAASRERAEADREHIIADASSTAERIRLDATAAIEQELQRSHRVLHEEAADLAVELAGNLLRDHVTNADRKRLVNEFIERIERTESDGAEPGR
jgi:F-type H+-transporting ATPase subunit b